MVNKTNTMPKDSEIFRTWYTRKPIETALAIKSEIMSQMKWDRNKWHRMLHGKTLWRQADKIAVEKVAAERIWI